MITLIFIASMAHASGLNLPSSSTVMDCGTPDPRKTLQDGTYSCLNYYHHELPNATFTLKNKKLEGRAFGYDEHGEPEFEGTYKNGLKDGEIKTRWSKAKKRFDKTTHFKAGKREGSDVEIVDDEANNFIVKLYKDDQRTGFVYTLRQGKIVGADDCQVADQSADKSKCESIVIPGYESEWKELKSAEAAKADQEKSDSNRQVIHKNRQGQMVERYTLKNGRIEGKHEQFFADGKPYLVTEKEASRKLSETEYFEDGQLKRKSTYNSKPGAPLGFEITHEEYYQNGKPKLIWTRSTIGKWNTTESFKEYFDNGQISSEGVRNGAINGYSDRYEGPIKFYDEKGKLIAAENYVNGEKDGLQKAMTLDENKQPLLIEDIYAKGVLQKTTTTDETKKKVIRIQDYFPDGSSKSDQKF